MNEWATPGQIQKMNARLKEQYDEIAHRAFEKHVLEIVRAWAPIEERAYREHTGSSMGAIVKNAELRGEYPNTVIAFTLVQPSLDRIIESSQPIWSPEFRTTNGKWEWARPEYVAGEILRYVHGG
jgi:hypothetical protein